MRTGLGDICNRLAPRCEIGGASAAITGTRRHVAGRVLSVFCPRSTAPHSVAQELGVLVLQFLVGFYQFTPFRDVQGWQHPSKVAAPARHLLPGTPGPIAVSSLSLQAFRVGIAPVASPAFCLSAAVSPHPPPRYKYSSPSLSAGLSSKTPWMPDTGNSTEPAVYRDVT